MPMFRLIQRLREIHRLEYKLSNMMLEIEAEFDGSVRQQKIYWCAERAEASAERLQKKLRALVD